MGKRDKAAEPEEDKFIVLFTALSMILLAFFIMLNSMAKPDASRERKVLDSLIGTFGPGLAQRVEDGALEGELTLTPAQLTQHLERLEEDLKGSAAAGLAVERRPGQIVVALPQALLFDAGGVRLKPASFMTLDEVGALLRRTDYKLRVIGHSDGMRPKGRLSNWYYSASRASSVHRYLEDVGKIAPGRIRSLGVAHTQPWPADAQEAGAASHRRVELIILIPDGPDKQVSL